MEIIAEAGSGVIVIINRQLGNGLAHTVDLREKVKSGAPIPAVEELRDYGVGAQILTELGVHDMILLTNTHHSLVALEGYGLSVVGDRTID